MSGYEGDVRRVGADLSLEHVAGPNKTTLAVTKRLVSLRLRLREGPVQLAARVGVAPSTAHRVLVRCSLNRLAHGDRASGEPVRRYEHPHPGSLIHVEAQRDEAPRHLGRREASSAR